MVIVGSKGNFSNNIQWCLKNKINKKHYPVQILIVIKLQTKIKFQEIYIFIFNFIDVELHFHQYNVQN